MVFQSFFGCLLSADALSAGFRGEVVVVVVVVVEFVPTMSAQSESKCCFFFFFFLVFFSSLKSPKSQHIKTGSQAVGVSS